MSLTEINKRFSIIGQDLRKQFPSLFEWQYLFLAPPVSNLWPGDPRFVLEESHKSLQLK